jgi:hypothetical protein
MNKYIKIIENTKDHNTHLRVELYYNKGGQNYYTGRPEKRGYYISVSPVELSTHGGVTMISETAFSGVRILAHECARKSKTAETAARTAAIEPAKKMIDYICAKNNYTVENVNTGSGVYFSEV